MMMMMIIISSSAAWSQRGLESIDDRSCHAPNLPTNIVPTNIA